MSVRHTVPGIRGLLQLTMRGCQAALDSVFMCSCNDVRSGIQKLILPSLNVTLTVICFTTYTTLTHTMKIRVLLTAGTLNAGHSLQAARRVTSASVCAWTARPACTATPATSPASSISSAPGKAGSPRNIKVCRAPSSLCGAPSSSAAPASSALHQPPSVDISLAVRFTGHLASLQRIRACALASAWHSSVVEPHI